MRYCILSMFFLFAVDFIGNQVIITNLDTNEVKVVNIDPKDISAGNVDKIVAEAMK